MKILYINEDRHEGILRAVENPENENHFIVPKIVEGIKGKQVIGKAFSEMYPNNRYSLKYRKMLVDEIVRYADEFKPDIIHFVSADEYLKLGGLTLGRLKKYKIVITLHWCKQFWPYKIMRYLLVSKVEGVIFHVYGAPKYKTKDGREKSKFLVLPPEITDYKIEKNKAREKLCIDTDRKVFCFAGTFEEYKGVDVLLDSLKNITVPIYLILAGNPKKYDKDVVLEKISTNPLIDSKIDLAYLTDEKLMSYVCASDYVLIPYKKGFAATSGPMTLAVSCGTPIIVPDTGNLAALTINYCLGNMFRCEDSLDLAKTIDDSAKTDFCRNERFEKYKNLLCVEEYRKQQQDFYDKVFSNGNN